jgi:hypothetical protein
MTQSGPSFVEVALEWSRFAAGSFELDEQRAAGIQKHPVWQATLTDAVQLDNLYAATASEPYDGPLNRAL